MFRLLRFFSITSLLVFGLVIVALALFYRRTSIDDLMRLEEDKNVVLTKAFANTLWPEYAPFIESAAALSQDEIRTHTETARLRQAVIDLTSGLDVVKVKIYNLEGKTIFSSEPAQIGESQAANPGVMTAKAGGIESELTHRAEFNSFDGVIEDREVLASYVPIRRSVDGPVEAIFELYTDVSYLLTEINLSQGRVVLIVTAILAALYAVLLLLVRYAERTIDRQYAERRRAEDGLRHRVFVEQMIAKLSTRFVNLTPDDTPAGVEEAVEIIGSALEVDTCAVVIFDAVSGEVHQTYRWRGAGLPPAPLPFNAFLLAHFAWSAAKLTRFEPLIIGRLADLPSDAAAERAALEQSGICSLLMQPLRHEKWVNGFLALGTIRTERQWTDETVSITAIVADMLATLLVRKETEDALHRSERRFESLVGSMSDVVFTVDVEGRYSGFYGRSLATYGVAVPDVLGKLPRDFMEPEAIAVHETATLRALAGETVAYDWTMEQRDATQVYFQTSLSPLRDGAGAIIGLVGVAHDITDLKRLELVKTEFIANVSHELRTPMASIVGYTELLLRGRPGPLTATQREFLQTVHHSSERLKLLVDELLDVSRIDAGRFRMRVERVRLDTLLRQARDRFLPIADEAVVQLTFMVPMALPELRGDLDRLNQVLDNLLSNAIKFTQAGGTVRVSVGDAQDEVRIEVADSGIGIPPDDLPRLFNRFYRAGNARAQSVNGAGLGLYIVRAIVEAHQGRIEVKSNLGEGTVFSVWLPTYQQAPEDVSTEPLAQEIADRFFDTYTS